MEFGQETQCEIEQTCDNLSRIILRWIQIERRNVSDVATFQWIEMSEDCETNLLDNEWIVSENDCPFHCQWLEIRCFLEQIDQKIVSDSIEWRYVVYKQRSFRHFRWVEHQSEMFDWRHIFRCDWKIDQIWRAFIASLRHRNKKQVQQSSHWTPWVKTHLINREKWIAVMEMIHSFIGENSIRDPHWSRSLSPQLLNLDFLSLEVGDRLHHRTEFVHLCDDLQMGEMSISTSSLIERTL